MLNIPLRSKFSSKGTHTLIVSLQKRTDEGVGERKRDRERERKRDRERERVGLTLCVRKNSGISLSTEK